MRRIQNLKANQKVIITLTTYKDALFLYGSRTLLYGTVAVLVHATVTIFVKGK
jgi:hypothetical protein